MERFSNSIISFSKRTLEKAQDVTKKAKEIILESMEDEYSSNTPLRMIESKSVEEDEIIVNEKKLFCPICDWSGMTKSRIHCSFNKRFQGTCTQVLPHIKHKHEFYFPFVDGKKKEKLNSVTILSSMVEENFHFPEFGDRQWKILYHLPDMKQLLFSFPPFKPSVSTSALLDLFSKELPAPPKLGKGRLGSRDMPELPDFIDDEEVAFLKFELKRGLEDKLLTHGFGEVPEQMPVPLMRKEWLSTRSKSILKRLGIQKVPMVKQPKPWPDWVPDPYIRSCYICDKMFIPLFRRKHHCRSCGQGFCEACCSTFRCLPLFGCLKSCRICKFCNVTNWQDEGLFWVNAPHDDWEMRLAHIRLALRVYDCKIVLGQNVPSAFPEGPLLLVLHDADDDEWEALIKKQCYFEQFEDAFDTLDFLNEKGIHLTALKIELAFKYREYRWKFLGNVKAKQIELIEFGETLFKNKVRQNTRL